MQSIVSLQNVSAGYENNPVFVHLSLELPKGQFAGIIGPTGSGKTTLLNTILGVHLPYSGCVLIDGQPASKVRSGTIGFVPQLETIDWSFPVTVEQIILMGLYTSRTYVPWTTRNEKQQVAKLASQLGIQDILKHHIRNISGGQQQRAFLARALINNPKLLVLDEPTSGVDMRTQHDVLHLLRDLNSEGISIIITTHDLNSVAAHLPWVICFNKSVIASGKPQEVLSEHILEQTYGGNLMIIRQGSNVLITHGKRGV